METIDKQEIRQQVELRVDEVATHGPGRSFWRTPLTGFVDAGDPGLEGLRDAVSETHLLPTDLLDTAASVVVVFIPFIRDLGRENLTGVLAARSWAEAYVETNRMFGLLGEHLGQWLERRGQVMVSLPATHNFDPDRLISDWSHRHLAVLAGLGKLGHHNLLITEQGCVGRLCSYVTDVPWAGDPASSHEACLHRAGRTCLKCVERCVGDALDETAFDRHACYAQCLENDSLHPDLGATDVCGKCLVVVPCSHVDPMARIARRENQR